jgi:hypothetical protein
MRHFQHGTRCPSRPTSPTGPKAPGSTITGLVDSSLADLRYCAQHNCDLCSALYCGGRHFAQVFSPSMNESTVVVQYLTELNAATLLLRVKATMSQIELNISVQEEQETPSNPDATTSALDQVVETTHKWLNVCTQTEAAGVFATQPSHVRCPPIAEHSLPTRVLDLRQDRIRLWVTNQEEKHYLTLSHCWGEKGMIMTTKENLETHQEGISLAELPRTFRDAVDITRGLGYSYLWIDSLCIIQDDQDDWERESTQMASIYQNSLLTIAASRALDAQSGCILAPGEKQYIWTPERSAQPVEQSRLPRSKAERIFSTEIWQPFSVGEYTVRLQPSHEALRIDTRRLAEDHIELGLPLFTRVWFLQERVLSPRVLHFGPMEMFWECFGGMRCECSETDVMGHRRSYFQARSHHGAKRCYAALLEHSTPGNPHRVANASSGSERISLWSKLVEEYSRLRLTYQRDRLPALLGIANSQPSYFAGTILNDFPQCLYWEFDPATRTAARRPPSFQAPTFSWASIEGPINYKSAPMYYPQFNTRKVTSELLHRDDKPEWTELYSVITVPNIIIRGWHGSTSVNRVFTQNGKSICEIQARNLYQTFALDVDIDVSGSAEVRVGDKITCLLLECGKADRGRFYQPVEPYQAVALALRPSIRVSTAYERVGLIYPRQRTDLEDPRLWSDLEDIGRIGGSKKESDGRDGVFKEAPRWFTEKSDLVLV